MANKKKEPNILGINILDLYVEVSWGSKPGKFHSAVRKAADLGLRYPIFGFRIALSI
ncbi:MAG: hypothetical protein ACFB02_13015 [Mastigocoleus sp.]